MFEMLAMPPIRAGVTVSDKYKKLGLPIYSLPGWEYIPLYAKLPMFKSPVGDVIFSKEKVGASLKYNPDFDSTDVKHRELQFDNYVGEPVIDYNPLHDKNLKEFFARPPNLRFLQNGRLITNENEVICSLKDFNRHRQLLYNIHVKSYPAEQKQKDEELKYRRLIQIADEVAENDNSLKKKQMDVVKSRDQILKRKKKVEEAKALKARLATMKTENHCQRFWQKQKEMEYLWQMRQVQTKERIKKCIAMKDQIERTRINGIESNVAKRNERVKWNKMRQKAVRKFNTHKRNVELFTQHLEYRSVQTKIFQELIAIHNIQQKESILKHAERHRNLWQKFAKKPTKEIAKDHYVGEGEKEEDGDKEISQITADDGRNVYHNLLSYDDLKAMLGVANDIEEKRSTLNNNVNTQLFNAANYFLNNVVKKFIVDLSQSKENVKSTTKRVHTIVDKIKNRTIRKATHIIIVSAKGMNKIEEYHITEKKPPSPNLAITFTKHDETIGDPSYGVPKESARPTKTRRATPPAVITERQCSPNKFCLPDFKHLSRNEACFVEYLCIKFGRQLTNNVERTVFNAIRKHREDEVVNFRPEFRKMDRNYLASTMARAILRYSLNEYDFSSFILLYSMALASEIVWELQKNLIKPMRDCKNNARSRCGGKQPQNMRLLSC